MTAPTTPTLGKASQTYAEAVALQRQAEALRDAASNLYHHASYGGSDALKGLVSNILRDANVVWRQSRRDADATGNALAALTSDYENVVKYHMCMLQGEDERGQQRQKAEATK